jgi:hypothetical protein
MDDFSLEQDGDNIESEYVSSEPAIKQDTRLSGLLVHLLKGIIYREQHSQLWSNLLRLEAQVRDYLVILGLDLTLDMDEGYAYLVQQESDEENQETPIPKLVARRPLTYEASLLCVLLRKRLAEYDRESGDSKVVIERDQIYGLLKSWLPEQNNEAKQRDQFDALINQIQKLGFLRKLKEDNHFEISRIIKAFVDADWLISLDEKLDAYTQ